MSCHPARIPPGWRRGVPGRCFVQSPAPEPGSAAGVGWVRAVKALKNMGQPVRWDGRAGVVHRQNRLTARCGQPQGHGAAGARVLDGIIQQDHRQPMQGGGIPLHGLAGVRPLQSGYSPANLLRLSSIYRAIPHNSKCRYGERGAAAAKPKAQIILCVLSSILATQMPCRSRRSGA